MLLPWTCWPDSERVTNFSVTETLELFRMVQWVLKKHAVDYTSTSLGETSQIGRLFLATFSVCKVEHRI